MQYLLQDAGFILIVDDNPTNLSVLSQALKSAGFTIRIAEDGESAISLVSRKPPALILLDIQMPGISGFEVCQQLKSNPLTQNIPIIFMTALADTESKIKGLSLGAVDYIAKPFEQEEVIARVRIHLQLKLLNNQLEQQVKERTETLEKAQLQIVQQEKMSMLGQLVAGVAHEINNPIGCICGNMNPIKEYITDITQILQVCQENESYLPDNVRNTIASCDLEFIIEDLPKLLNSIKLSTERIKGISISLRNFARADTSAKVAVDLHEGIDGTLLILGHRIKASSQRPDIEIIKQYNQLPKVECYPGQINQVFMNILANAIDAIDENWQHNKLDNNSLTIKINTEISNYQYVTIRITDNGMGMSEVVQNRVFEQFFTTKPMGQGTGLGLAIAYQIIVEKHNGKLAVNSTPGQGTEFVITLPI
ncbi:MAG: hybrid sensor histidine kinase/response regulator [Cyanomargarita calcarea GSE-NOS-MK-12-04C]|jgi:signal transduction histidine kinase|uniref:histidine kinase n=1 Tax=Cyanomargarita calcarea GSE-NOS-MK-12-04C TaxID=2839659 RepID=A0A951QKC3_9CYAN|nr:hybrid sensor histidine kinase/response regulator [Cyanomargarita calcarea GSE-NOS-MK-12-04C]